MIVRGGEREVARLQSDLASLLTRTAMAAGAFAGCVAVLLVLMTLYARLARARNRKITERLRQAKRNRSEMAGASPEAELTAEPLLAEKALDSNAKAKRLRETIDGIHARMNTRTAAYLALNGTVLGILAGLKPAPEWSVALALAVMLVNFLGLTTNHQYVTDLRVMHLEHDEIAPDDPAVRALKDAGVGGGPLSPTMAFAFYLPAIVLAGWFIFLVAVWPF